MTPEMAIIIGAGPAGLTAAYELIDKTDIRPIVYESADVVGGISKTVDYRGNKIDIGGHRFFSKSPDIVDWWLSFLPLQGRSPGDEADDAAGVPIPTDPDGPDPEKTDAVMLWRKRRSRILYAGQLFDYPISPSLDTLRKLGPKRVGRIAASYLRAQARPIATEKSLEDFFINRFGKELYLTFFRDYTEKLWGIPCTQISPEWGAQRIKGLSLTRAVLDAARRVLPINPARTETSLIKHFLYPKFGPGQLWTKVAEAITEKRGQIHLRHTVVGLTHRDRRITGVRVRDEATGEIRHVAGDHFFSTMAVTDLAAAMEPAVPDVVGEVATGLRYRDFVTVGLLLKKLRLRHESWTETVNRLILDSWLYIQEPYVRVGRVQIFNNWSPYLVRDRNTVWVGLEYFCNEGDLLWTMENRDLATLAVAEMVRMGFVSREDVLDSTVIRMPKAYPAYFGTYDRFAVVRDYTDRFENLFLVGRNGMHRYNNSDHSMLSAMTAVAHITKGITSKDAIWSVNTEVEYHEAASDRPQGIPGTLYSIPPRKG